MRHLRRNDAQIGFCDNAAGKRDSVAGGRSLVRQNSLTLWPFLFPRLIHFIALILVISSITVGLRTAPAQNRVGVLLMKLTASSVLPVPLYLATCG